MLSSSNLAAVRQHPGPSFNRISLTMLLVGTEGVVQFLFSPNTVSPISVLSIHKALGLLLSRYINERLRVFLVFVIVVVNKKDLLRRPNDSLKV